MPEMNLEQLQDAIIERWRIAHDVFPQMKEPSRTIYQHEMEVMDTLLEDAGLIRCEICKGYMHKDPCSNCGGRGWM